MKKLTGLLVVVLACAAFGYYLVKRNGKRCSICGEKSCEGTDVLGKFICSDCY